MTGHTFGAMRRRDFRNVLLLGLMVGSVFGAIDLFMTWVHPLGDDSPTALLRFYGPMFLAWTAVSFRAAHGTGRLSSGVAAGTTMAFATFFAFVLVNFLRVNLFFDQLTARSDWLNLMLRFRASGVESLRKFVNLDYLEGTPFKMAVATALGAVMGAVGGAVGRLLRPAQGSIRSLRKKRAQS